MESISYYGGSDEEQEYSNNSRPRDNSSTNNYGNYESTSVGHSSSDTTNSRRRKVIDDTNYEEIQMDLSEDSNASENHSSQAKVSDSKPKKSDTDFMAQSSHRSDKHNRSDEKNERSSSKEFDRYKGDKNKEGTSRDRFSDKGRDKTADRYRNRDKDRDRDRYSRDKGRSKPDRDDKYSRHRDSRSDSRRDRNDKNDRNERDQRRDRTNSDNKERNERGRDRRHSTKSKSRSRSRDRSNATVRSHQHDRNAIKEPPKSLMSLQLPKMPLSMTSTTTAIKPIEPVTVAPNIISPLLVSARYTEQMQKRKLLWGNKKAEGEPQQTTNNKWEQTKFSQDSDGKMASKFLRLMGMKDAPKVAEDETQKAPDSIKKQNEMLSSMEQQYEVARQMTHTMRGMGLGFGTQPRHY